MAAGELRRGVSRRTFVKGASLLPLVALLPRHVVAAVAPPFHFFTDQEAAVVTEATARMIPGPTDDPLETGHPGAREANVVGYIDLLLSALTFTPERIHAAGDGFVGLSRAQRLGWERRMARLRSAYRAGIPALDAAAGGDFTSVPGPAQDLVLADADPTFRDLLFTHAIEGTYSLPIYGGNANRSGWQEIRFPGESQPRGYTDDEVSRSDGPDPVDPSGVIQLVINNLGLAAGSHAR